MKCKALKAALAFASSAAMLFSSVSIPPSETLTAVAATTVNNPVIWSDVPDNDVIRVGDTYYMVSTTMYFSPGAPIMKSTDLVNWHMCNYVYDRLAEGDGENLIGGKHDYGKGSWAASLRYNEKTKKFYVFFGSYSTNKSYIYSTDDIENGEWTKSEINGMYHDASILFDDDGRNYLVYGGGEIKIKELNSEMTGFKQGGVDKTLFKTNISGYVSGEGSHIQKIGDYYYIFIIAWPSGHGRLELCYRSKELLGNYESKTVLESGVGSYSSGLAQGGIVDTPDGKWYGMLFQDHGAVGRIPSVVPVEFVDGWPMMGVNGKAPVTLNIENDGSGSSLAGDDDFTYTSDDLALEWQWNHNPDNNAWSVTEREGYLRLHNNHIANDLLHARNTLTMRTEGPACSSIIKMDTKGMKSGDYAGLSAFQFKYGNIGVYVDGSGNKKVYMATNGGDSIDNSSNKIQAEAPMSGDEVYLKVDFKFATVGSDGSSSNNIDKANFYYSFDGNSWTKLGTELSMDYDLKLFTGYRSGIYSYPTKSTGGYVDIDYFDYDRTAWNGSDGSYTLGGKTPKVYEPDEDGYYFHDTFESGTDGWSGRGSASVAASKSAAYAGSQSLLTTDREASWNGATKALSKNYFKAGEKYSFSADVMYDTGAASQTFFLTLQYRGSDNEVYYPKIDTKTVSKGEWVQLSNTSFEIPAGATELQFYVETETGSGNFYVDEAIGAPEGTVVAGPKGTSHIRGDLTGDEKINVFDVMLARRGLVKGSFESTVAKNNADVDQDGEFNVSDLILINQFVLGRITEFPVVTPPTPDYTMASYTAKVKDLQVEKEPDSSHQTKGGVTYGEIKSATYWSSVCNREKKYNILLPPNYDPSKKYPVLYVMHGYYENPDRMIIKGNVESGMPTKQIVGNCIADGSAKEMICVFPDVFSSPTLKACTGMDETNNQAYDNFINDLTKCLMPEIEDKYSILTGKENTAITGFSMGGREGLLIGMARSDLFGYVGAICPAPGVTGSFKWDSDNEPYLLLITGGDNDKTVYDNPKNYHENFEKNGVPHLWQYVHGGYHGDNCINAHLYNFVRMIFHTDE
ncbi:MAG: family 43 glycosylhydrolase [Ruminococcus sp.]|nr:family 43 glycosylhydrolase [Ruminococcus sp.]